MPPDGVVEAAPSPRHGRRLRSYNSVGRSSALLGRPSGGLAEFTGARQVSWLATYRRRRLPGLSIKSSGEKSVGTPLTVAGAATDRREAYRVPFSPSGKIEGPCATLHSSFAEGCQIFGILRDETRALAPRPPSDARQCAGDRSHQRRPRRGGSGRHRGAETPEPTRKWPSCRDRPATCNSWTRSTLFGGSRWTPRSGASSGTVAILFLAARRSALAQRRVRCSP